MRRGESSEVQADVSGQLAIQVQRDAWTWAITKGQVLIHGSGAGGGAVLMSVTPVVTVGCAEACGGVMLVFEGHAAFGVVPIWVACMATRGHGDKLGCC